MKILARKQNGWQELSTLNYNNEAEMQQLLAEDPNILPLEEIGYDQSFVTIGKEVLLGTGMLDIMAVDAAGHIALIETKLRQNPEIRRTVIGQILDYAAHLWGASYDELDKVHFRKCLPQLKRSFAGSLAEYMAEQVGEEQFDAAVFREGIEKRLKLGSFTLLIVVDETTTDLRDIADYLNDRTDHGIDFYVVEVEMRGEKPNEVLIPRLVNPARKSAETTVGGRAGTSDPYDRTPQTAEAFLSTLNDTSRKVAEEILAAFANDERVKTAWRKTGFSLSTPMPVNLTPDYKGNFSFLFFTNGQRNEGRGEINFDYPQWYIKQFPKIAELAKDYMAFVMSLDLNKKGVLEDPAQLVAKTEELRGHITDTAEVISKGEMNNK